MISLGSDIAQLAAQYEAAKKRTAELQAEKKEMKDTRQRREAESARLERHLKEETKKHEKFLKDIEKQRTGVKTESAVSNIFKGWGGGSSTKKVRSGSLVSAAMTETPRLRKTPSELLEVHSPRSSSPRSEGSRKGMALSDVGPSSPEKKKKKTVFQKMKNVFVGVSPIPEAQRSKSSGREDLNLTARRAFDANMADTDAELSREVIRRDEPKAPEIKKVEILKTEVNRTISPREDNLSNRVYPEMETVVAGNSFGHYDEQADPIIPFRPTVTSPPQKVSTPSFDREVVLPTVEHLIKGNDQKSSAVNIQTTQGENVTRSYIVDQSCITESHINDTYFTTDPRRTEVMLVTESLPPALPKPVVKFDHRIETDSSTGAASWISGSECSVTDQFEKEKKKKKKKGFLSLFKGKKKSEEQQEIKKSPERHNSGAISDIAKPPHPMATTFETTSEVGSPSLEGRNAQSSEGTSSGHPKVLDTVDLSDDGLSVVEGNYLIV